MAKLMNIGFGNMVCANRLVAIVSPESAPIKRIIQDYLFGFCTGKAYDLPGKRAGDFDRRDAGKKNQERDFY